MSWNTFPIATHSECFRCLRPGGILLFSAPFRLDRSHNLERARVRPDGTIEHLMPPEYHWNPLTSDNGTLSFRDFGWHVLEQMREAGFADPRALLYWSLELGYLGAIRSCWWPPVPPMERKAIDPGSQR
jgi:hypothetical protein